MRVCKVRFGAYAVFTFPAVSGRHRAVPRETQGTLSWTMTTREVGRADWHGHPCGREGWAPGAQGRLA